MYYMQTACNKCRSSARKTKRIQRSVDGVVNSFVTATLTLVTMPNFMHSGTARIWLSVVGIYFSNSFRVVQTSPQFVSTFIYLKPIFLGQCYTTHIFLMINRYFTQFTPTSLLQV